MFSFLVLQPASLPRLHTSAYREERRIVSTTGSFRDNARAHRILFLHSVSGRSATRSACGPSRPPPPRRNQLFPPGGAPSGEESPAQSPAQEALPRPPAVQPPSLPHPEAGGEGFSPDWAYKAAEGCSFRAETPSPGACSTSVGQMQWLLSQVSCPLHLLHVPTSPCLRPHPRVRSPAAPRPRPWPDFIHVCAPCVLLPSFRKPMQRVKRRLRCCKGWRG